MSLWWFEQLADLVPNHVLSTDVPDVGARPGRRVRAAGDVPGRVRRARLPHRLRPARLRATGEVCGIALPAGLEDGSRLPGADLHPGHQGRRSATTTRTSPTTRSSPPSAPSVADRLRDLTLAVYGRAEEIARERGIILADTKFEFGARAGRHDRARRRGADPGLLAVLAGRPSGSPVTHAAVVRQADRAQLGCSRRSPAGTGRPARRRRRCRPRSSSAPAPATSRRTSGSPACRW